VPAYLLVAFLSIGSLLDILVTAWPAHLHDPNWRLAVANNAAGASGTEMLSLLILIVVAQLAVAPGFAGFAYAIAMVSGYAIAAVMFAPRLAANTRSHPAEQARYDVSSPGRSLVSPSRTSCVFGSPHAPGPRPRVSGATWREKWPIVDPDSLSARPLVAPPRQRHRPQTSSPRQVADDSTEPVLRGRASGRSW
jgi:hypothetical protein